MQSMPRRAGTPSLVQAVPPPWGEAAGDGPWGGAKAGKLVGRLRAVRRGLSVVLFTAVMAMVQGVCLLVPGRGAGRAKVVVARLYWAGVCRLIGFRVRLVGVAGRHPLVFVSNHSSWLDVPVLGGTLEACFVSKAEVAGWPLIRTVARLGRTVFVSRRAREVGRERDAMRARLDAGDSLILFPEGTSNDGSRVLPFRSSFFSVVEVGGTLIQPVSVVYDQLGGLPIGRANRAVFAWYGDMELGSHFWRLAQLKGLRATVLLHAPIDPAAFASRKALSSAVWEVVAVGAARLRQNRSPVA